MTEDRTPVAQSEHTRLLLRKVLDRIKGLCNNVISVTQFHCDEEWEMEKESVRMVHVRLSPELHKQLRVKVAEEDTSIQDWVAALIERELKSDRRK